MSYFVDISLESSSSAYNPYLEVLLVNGRHQLITKNAIYSFDDKYENFYAAFKHIDWDKLKVQKVLVLGLGLGSVIYMLEKNFNKRFEYTCVEIDPEIIRLANKYCLSQLDSRAEIMETDAESFLRIDSNKYDLILMDIFQNAKVPGKFSKKEFIEVLKSKLDLNGLLLYNRMNINQEDRSENLEFSKKFADIFPDHHALQVKDNLVYFSGNDVLLKK